MLQMLRILSTGKKNIIEALSRPNLEFDIQLISAEGKAVALNYLTRNFINWTL